MPVMLSIDPSPVLASNSETEKTEDRGGRETMIIQLIFMVSIIKTGKVITISRYSERIA